MNPGSDIKKAITGLISTIGRASVPDRSALLGFDACIDTVVRVVKQRLEDNSSEYFGHTGEFGDFLRQLGDRSCGLELKTKVSRPGGNMVITANALGRLGVKADCIGTFGYPDIVTVFRNISPNCSLYSVAETITATALEFDVSKVIMFDPGSYNYLTWDIIRQVIGIDKLKQLVSGKKLVSFLNWSEIENSSAIWTGFLEEIFHDFSTDREITFFTDLSDCSRKSKDEIKGVAGILKMLKKHFRVILSLNVNESVIVAGALGIPYDTTDEVFMKNMHKACNVDVLLIHRIKDALACDDQEVVVCDTFFSGDPKILTGGGDNFNAGYCFSRYFDLSLFESLLLANSVAGYYVQEGYSPDINELLSYLYGIIL